MKKRRDFFTGGIRRKIFSMLLITMVLIIAAYTAVFFYQSTRVERLVSDTYEAQKQIYIDSGLEDQYESFRSSAVESFHREMFKDHENYKWAVLPYADVNGMSLEDIMDYEEESADEEDIINYLIESGTSLNQIASLE